MAINHLDYEVHTPREVVEDAKAWCYQQWGTRWEALGNRSGTWSVFWAGRGIPGYYRWHFATEQQALMFTLKWAK
jgi:hypothetical protein